MITFKDLSGRQDLQRVLPTALGKGTLSHAVLLCGPAGSGKRTWGRALAIALLCPDQQGGEPCLSCLSCRQFGTGNHPGFFYLEPRGRRLKIEQLREARSRFFYEGANRVCLINQADRMTAEAASSLLKILEEPPEGLYFILLAEQPRLLFSTILSRCQRFSMQPLSDSDIMDILMQEAPVSPEKATLCARLSNGLPGSALALSADPSFDQRIEEAAVLANRLAAGAVETREMLAYASELAEREDLVLLLNLIYLYYRDCLIQLLCADDKLLTNPGQARLSGGEVPPVNLEEAVELIRTTLREIESTNINRRLALEGMLITLQRRFAQCPE